MTWRILVGGIAIGLAAMLLGEPRDPQITQPADRFVAIATLPCAKNLQATSSGIVIDDETVVTVAHALFDSRDFAIRDSFGVWHEGELIHIDLERDLATVRVPGLRATPMSTAAAVSGASVTMLEGAASGTVVGVINRPVRIRTEVIGDLSQESLRDGYEVGLEITAGDSGAGIVDDDGRLVGLVFARSRSREAVTWATSVAEVDEILDLEGVPEWDCTPGIGIELQLGPPKQDQLAG